MGFVSTILYPELKDKVEDWNIKGLKVFSKNKIEKGTKEVVGSCLLATLRAKANGKTYTIWGEPESSPLNKQELGNYLKDKGIVAGENDVKTFEF